MTADDVTGRVSKGSFKSSLRHILNWFSMNKNGSEKISTVSWISLMRYARPLDILLMCVGTLAGFAHGAVLPIFIYIAGNVVNLFVNRAAHLCPLNLTQLADEYCPADVRLDINNFYVHIRKCNLTGSNMTLLYSDFKGVASTQTKYFVSIGCAAIILGYIQASFWNMSAARQTRSIRRHLFRAIMHKEMAYFDTHTTGDLNSRLTDSINTIHHGIGDKVGLMLEYIGSCIAGFTIGLIKSWQLSLVIISVSPVVFFAVMLYSKILNRVALMEIKAYERAGTVAEEVFSSIRTVFAYNGQEREKERYVQHLQTAKVNGIRKGMLTGLTMGFIMLVIRGSFALGFWYGTTLVLDHRSDVGTVITVFFAMFDGLFKLAHAGQYYQSIAEAKVAAHSVWQVIDTPSSIETDTETGIKKDDVVGDIHFDKVHFHYPSRPTIKILNGITFDATHGQTIALVGASGSGKSTCIQLLQRFYDPDAGSIRVDGHSINEYNVRWFRQQIGVVSQESVLFHASIRDNILLGRETATEDELIEAAKIANAHDFIMALPQKYDTLVGERGTALSGGQKQRIAIARALIRDPKILLLDEATSALDNESEKMVQDALMHASQGRTTFIIAHRLSTIRHADKILVMSKGQIIEEGNHESLMHLEGTYFNLVQQQALQTTDEEDFIDDNDEGRGRAETMMSAVSTLPDQKIMEEDEIQTKEKDPNVTLAMLQMNKPEWLWIIIGCIICILYGIAQPAFGIVLSKLFSMFQTCDKSQQERDVQIYALVFFGFGVFAFICSFLQYYAFAYSGEALTQRLRAKTFEAILRQDMSFFDDPSNSTGSLCTRLSTEASAIRGASGVRIGVILGNLFSVGAGIVLAFVFSWQLTLAILAFIPFIAIGIFLQNHFMSGASENNRKSQNETSKLTVESMQNIRTVIQLTREEYFCSKYNELVNVPFRASMKQAHIVGILFSLSESIMHFIGAVIASFGAVLIERDEMTFEDCMIVLLCILYGAWHIGATASMAPDYAKAVDAAKKILALLARQPSIDNQTNQGHQISEITGSMELCDVQFSYPSRPDAIVLRKTHLKIDAGQKVAIVGASGCGKSTIIQLFERFYDPLKGSVLVDGEDIRELDLKWYRSQLGIVLQEPALFDTSIRENIAYGDTSRKDVPMEDIMEVARQANIHDFIQQLPEGYETNCGAKGVQLSGGQKQRIAIARALLRNPKVLLLDEATSALDSENERIVQEALDEAQKNRTTITIAHRLSTIQNSDVICVMHRGRVVEMGTHGELMAFGRRYYRLVEAKLR